MALFFALETTAPHHLTLGLWLQLYVRRVIQKELFLRAGWDLVLKPHFLGWVALYT